MISPRPNVLNRLKGRLIVSCQAATSSPLSGSGMIAAMAQAVTVGGAAGLRLEGLENIAVVRGLTELPLIGLVKEVQPDSEVYITPTPAHVAELCRLGADIIAFDATDRPRPVPVPELVATVHAGGSLAMADISTLAEAQVARARGADLVGTTLSGYTPYSPRIETPDYALMEALADARIPFIAEGRIRSPADAVASLERGAFAVVVGTAITRPDVVTGWYVAALAGTPPHR